MSKSENENPSAQERAREVRQKMKGRELPPASFIGFLSGLYSQALIQLGAVEDPVTGRPEVDLPSAKFTIDTIEIVKEKTRSNLNDNENKAMDHILYELRMAYIKATK